jgi:DUF2075 family protein
LVALLRASGTTLLELVTEKTVAGRIAGQFAHEMGYRAGDGEVRSWEHSLPVLAEDLRDAGLLAVEVLVEHRLPLSIKRIDVVLAVSHPKTGAPSYVVVELKQWSKATVLDDAGDLVHIDAYGARPVLHPVEQVRRYCSFLRDFTRALADLPDAIVGAAYLHNADEAAVAGLRLMPESTGGRLFLRSDRGRWLDFLRARLASTAGADSADLLVNSAIAPSQKLLALAAAEIRDREQFVLLDEQQVAASLVLRAVRRARQADLKTAVVVNGGPGSGKSVIALSLLGDLARQGRTVLHATGSKAFTETLRRTAGHRDGRVKGMFKYFNSFMSAGKNDLDVLISDEAHRIRSTSNNRFTAATRRSDRRQVDELLDAARVPVFLLDDHQVVRPGETGRRDLIVAAARESGLDVETVDLRGQFRSGGSRGYEEWVLRLLGLAPGGPVAWDGDERFAVEVVDGPAELELRLADAERDGYMARMTGGFCWPWSDARAPPSFLWASEDGGFGQVGCVYTAQGFEYDWNGVIFGPDLVWRDGRFVSQVSESKDPAFRGQAAGQFDAAVRNVYKVLLTRGMAGTVITSTDAQTREALRSLVSARVSVDQPA